MDWNSSLAADDRGTSYTETNFPRSTGGSFIVSLTISLAIVLVTVLHFLTPVNQIVWHEVYQRLYYIPIIAAALLFGLRGGLGASLFTTIVYSPHIYLHWQQGHFDYSINQYAEIVIFNLVGGIMGALGDRLRHARVRAETNAEQRRQAYEELQKTFGQLLQAEKLSSLGELSAGIVHEVRNPLGSIKGAVEILEDELSADSPRREFANIAKKEIERVDELLGEFLRFARPASLSAESRDLMLIVNSVISIIKNQAAIQGVLIEIIAEGELRKVIIDGEQIKQVLLNLAINSLQAMQNGGELAFRMFEVADQIIIEVSDTGTGIDEAVTSKIFDPFFSTKEKGIGLGLSIAHRIATQHGGTLSCKSDGKGGVFALTLPVISRPTAPIK